MLAYIGPDKFNATKAAITAGYSEHSAARIGHELINYPQVAARVKLELGNRHLTADSVLSELADVANADWSDFLQIKRDRNGEPIDVKMDLTAKMKALELIGKAHGLFTDRLDLSGSLTSKVEIVGVDEADI